MTNDFKLGGCHACGSQACVARECARTTHYYTFGGAKITETHKLNADQTVVVATDVFWNEDMSQAPRGVKLQLLGAGGVAYYGTYNGDPFWVGWCPLPKRRKKV